MLADDVLAITDRATRQNSHGVLDRLQEEIPKAARFSISPEVVASVVAILSQPLSSQVRALQLCRLPFRSTWFEWTDPDIPHNRVGALVQTEVGVQRGVALFAERGHVWPLVLTFDWREEPVEFPWSLRVGALYDQKRAELGRQEDGFKEYVRRVGIAVISDNGQLTVPAASPPSETVQRLAMRLETIRAVVLLLNSKNLTGVTAADTPSAKLQRARAKCGKPPLLDYSRIDIRLSGYMARHAGQAADPRSPLRLHVVRGHFKIRKTGVFWWSAYARGDAEIGAIAQQTRHIRH
jgi:hypothetical protein